MSTVQLERHGACMVIQLHRPDRLNALTPHMVNDLSDALDAAEADEGSRVIVITGSGRAFCAGADLEFADPDTGPGHAAVTCFLEALHGLFVRIERLRMPVIAAVNGVAVGGGLELVLCCDLVLAATSARLGDAHATYGFVPAGGASVRLPRRVGLGHAKYLMYTGCAQTAQEMHAAGLVNEVVPDADLQARSLELGNRIAERSPLGLARMKQLLHDGLEQSVETALRAELVMSEVHRRSNDNRAGIRAFKEKRRPEFQGN